MEILNMGKSLSLDTVERWQKVHREKWQIGPKRGAEDSAIAWIPVAEIRECGVLLGICSGGFWVRGGGATVEVADGQYPVTMLPCLEVTTDKLLGSLEQGLADLGAPKELAMTFPLRDVVLCGLKSQSERWITLAFAKLKEGVWDESYSEVLEELIQDAPTQRLRHQAREIFKERRYEVD